MSPPGLSARSGVNKKTLAENFEQKKAAENSGLFFPKN